MAFLKGLRRDEPVTAVATSSANGRHVPGAREAAALEALIARAEKAAEQLRSLDSLAEKAESLGELHERIAAVHHQLSAVEALAERFGAVEAQLERVSQRAEDLSRLEQRLGELGGKLDAALELRALLHRVDPETLRGQLAELAENVGRMRGQADDALSAHRHATGRLETLAEDHLAATNRLDEVARRTEAVERSIEPLTQAIDAIPNVQHQLAVLKALADQLSQKSATLEQQREAVDRAATQISQLTRLDRELDAWLRRQEEQIRRFGAIEAKLAEVHATHAKIAARHEELSGTQQHIDEGHRAARQALTDLREQMRKSSEGFELEHRGLHAVSERVADLRAAVKECEARFDVLDGASQGAAAVQAQTQALSEQATGIGQEVIRLNDELRRVGSMRLEAERLVTIAGETAQRMQRIDELTPRLDAVVDQLAGLQGTSEMMADGLEQMRLAYEEMTRLREVHAETQAWLTQADGWTKKVQSQVNELSAMEPGVERIRGEVEQVKAAMEEIEARRSLVDDVQRRLAELGSASAELKERTEGLRGRMEGAENRFVQLAKHADEAQRVSDLIGSVVASVQQAEQRIGGVDDSVRALEARSQQLEELEERIRILGVEIEQRQGALDKATEHLAKASALRQEAADAAERLQQIARTIATQLTDADERSGLLVDVAANLEGRSTALKIVEKQLGKFESLLAKWDSAQSEAARGLEQTLARQGAVDALEHQVKHVFGLAEKAVADVQEISGARHDIDETRALLDATQAQFKATEETLKGFDARQRQLERAEQRLARAEALAIDVRSTVESLQAQRTLVDHVIERAGALSFQIKQAEALVDTLKRERTLACELKAAVGAVREEDEEE
jgi:DNA repair exonuclease SbcCD ATPase subunit